MRLNRFLFLLLSVSAFATALAQTAVVSRAGNLRPEPTTDSKPIRSLAIGTRLHLVESETQLGYYYVETDDGDSGYIWEKLVKLTSPAEATSLATAAASGTKKMKKALLGADGHPACTVNGDAAPGSSEEKTDVLKVRTATPPSSSINTLTWTKVLAPGNDSARFDQGDAAVIVAYVQHVNPGGSETVNCHGKKPADTHIALVGTKAETELTNAQAAKKIFVVEVTPQWRDKNPAWTTDNLKTQLPGEKVRITGWMLRDWTHKGVADHTAKKATTKRERATAWEIHPITKLELWTAGAWHMIK
jgi:hypothetical protein